MQNHFDLSDPIFEQQFANCQLDPTLFSHEAHLRLAWIHIDKYGIRKAVENIGSQLKKFVVHVRATDKYHQTITITAIQAVNHFMKQSKSDNFKDFIIEFPQLKNDFKSLINSHYTMDVFNSEVARKEYIKPDLIPF
ncbi:hypothetical protein [Aquimarina sp. 2201CG5-10]|uniref:hypothetical protein n=1 Tax=Aquimarina callyspongiae TaxID=3098150 RepID=UPI002AB4ECA4|nr:hypothetical protein [Aquimarina sp. 2201CG5-10]MDY8137436.1 hypothetical protein [Aquimarina sp. 2201CG5-10]